MVMPGRKFSAGTQYRYGFNGKENDNEVKGEGNQQDYGMRIYDPRLGKFLSVDPLTQRFPFYTPYSFAGNMPISAIDLDGSEPRLTTIVDVKTQHRTHILTIDVKVIGVENFSNKESYLDVATWANKVLARCFSKNNDANNTFVASLNFTEVNEVDTKNDFYLEFRKDGKFFTPFGNANAFGEVNAIGGNAAIVASDLALQEVARFKQAIEKGQLNLKMGDYFRTDIGPEGNYLFGNQMYEVDNKSPESMVFLRARTTYDYTSFYIGSVVAHEIGHLLGLGTGGHGAPFSSDEERSKFGPTAFRLMQGSPLYQAFNVIGRQKGNFSLSSDEVKSILDKVKDRKEVQNEEYQYESEQH
jgi:RHS repeat-associated protein